MARRRGSILLEILLAIVLFAGAAAVTIACLNSSLSATRQAAVRLRAADLARTAISEIEAGIEEESRVATRDPDGLVVDLKTTRSAFPGLTLCEVTIRGPGEDGGERVLFELRQLVRTSEGAARTRRPRRRRRRTYDAARRGFTLFEVVVSLGLVALLVVAMGAFLSDALRVRSAVGDRVARALSAEAAVGEVERALETCVVSDRTLGSGVVGTATSIDVVRCGIATWRLGTAEPERAFEPLERSRVVFQPAEDGGRIAIGRGDEAPTPLPGTIHRLAFRYYDGVAWSDTFDSAAAGRLPVAVEISIWLDAPKGEPTVLERPEFDDEAREPELEPELPPDRRRVIAIPDPAGEAAP